MRAHLFKVLHRYVRHISNINMYHTLLNGVYFIYKKKNMNRIHVGYILDMSQD